jgi:hypothetical protein
VAVNEALEGAECKIAGGASQEGKSCRNEVVILQEAVKTILLSLLANDGSDGTGECSIAVLGEDDRDILQGTENDICEGLGQLGGVLTSRGWELVVAWVDGRSAKMLQPRASIECVLDLLVEMCRESGDDEILLSLVLDFEAGHVVCDVVDEG